MLATLQGYRALDFTTEDSKRIRGTQLFISFDEDNVVGQATDKLFVKPEVELPTQMQQGDSLEIYFDRKGKVESVFASEE